MKTVSLKLSDELAAELNAAAKLAGVTKSDIMRRALDLYVSDAGRTPKGSFLDLAGELIGCVEGPADLSCNPDHMRGFGQ